MKPPTRWSRFQITPKALALLAHGEYAKPGELHGLPPSQAIRDLVQYLLDKRFTVMRGQTDLAPHCLIQVLARDCLPSHSPTRGRDIGRSENSG